MFNLYTFNTNGNTLHKWSTYWIQRGYFNLGRKEMIHLKRFWYGLLPFLGIGLIVGLFVLYLKYPWIFATVIIIALIYAIGCKIERGD
jgi:hypothetical protein